MRGDARLRDWHDHYPLGRRDEAELDPSADEFWDALAGILAEELVLVCCCDGDEYHGGSLRALQGLDLAAAAQDWTIGGADRIRVCSWHGTHDTVVPIPDKYR